MADSNCSLDGSTTVDRTVSRTELAMARRVDGWFELAAQTRQFTALLVLYVVLTIVGAWLRTILIPQAWEVAAACGFIAVMAWALPWLLWISGRKPPTWVAAAESCERSLEGRMPAPIAPVVQEAIDRIRQRSRFRHWHSAHMYLSRCAKSGPPDADSCQIAGVVPMSGRLVVVIGEHMATVSPQITAAVLAHESRHTYMARVYLSYLIILSRLVGWVIIGWAVPWRRCCQLYSPSTSWQHCCRGELRSVAIWAVPPRSARAPCWRHWITSAVPWRRSMRTGHAQRDTPALP
jgi:hypothetical protein